MTSTVPGRTDWLTLPPFDGLSIAGRERLLAEARPCRFRVGEDLSNAGSIGDRVLVLHEGEARLLGERDGRPFTLERLGPGAIVGLVSLLRAEGIEPVSAASELLATAVPDTLMLELLLAEDGLRQWCGRHLWTAELHQLLLQRDGAAAGRFDPPLWREKIEQLRLRARGVLPTAAGAIALQDGEDLLLASANVPDLPIGSLLAATEPLPQPRPPLPLRLLALTPAPAVAVAPAPSPSDTTADQAIEPMEAAAGGQAQPSSLDLGQDRADRHLTLVRGTGPLEETLACFQMLGKLLELPYRRDAVDKILRDKMRRGQPPDLQLCGQIAAMLGLLVTGAKVPAASATRLITPCLVPWKEGFAIATASNAAGLRLASPAEGWVQLSPAQIAETYPEGLELLLLERSIDTPEQTFGPGWFWPALKRYRGMLLQVLLASFVVQLFSLANPLLIQVIIDKVISQRSLDTLQILGMALVVVTLMEGVIGSLRTFLFTDTTNRIDLRLGAEVIDHLLRLPLGYFDKRPVGELGTRIAELEKIRNFLTGQALITLLDAAFSVIYIIVMAIYSWLLTLIALAVLPIQVGLTLLGAPLFRRQYRQAAEENARTQSHLVEVLTGIQTVKAQNVEMVSRWKWQELYAKYISRTFEKTITGTFLNETSSVLQKLSQLLVLWVGATMVLKGELTLGQLIAFRIISGYVTQPLLRLSSIWQNIQELRVSFERLADVVDTPEESSEADRGHIPLPPVKGDVVFENLSFRFNPGGPEVLSNVNLHVPPGTFTGIVGQSGSGKSTLMKLLPRLYSPSKGRILVDGYDIDKVELYSLRRQVGIVPQDPLLFSGTISENIALTNPEAPSDAIVEAARIAGAHDFIMELSSGYSTPLGERGASLSGGQRQRIAIARTLLSQPQLLVMDEATSALDYDTERQVCDNLREAMSQSTVFFITHRLSTIRRADLIVMMHQGAIVETGTHEELMALKGRYFALYRQQEAG
ncbi:MULTISPECIES: peptidase domain-containing ABC transporter [unclassified Cyanobium]|uniref:peptidase domain-containing ABC transporter n=1 Tax=unclassified Cyanobium TaxID=2627006 RepID=UPI0020CEB447|nr:MULTISPECIES: peptidase domain-containing ABC transporter [unclassified Cyanobium]MCP9835822.1 peptidase domain-containing ABC transporter [Cyanobium sp. La Preciosa 7G6]MCP9938589.1 peptidase domain-containing ABC transporter [Cyanobium sp. Aljojuca 7A6]